MAGRPREFRLVLSGRSKGRLGCLRGDAKVVGQYEAVRR